MEHAKWSRVARRQAGVIARRQLRASGLSSRQIDQLSASGALRTLGYGTWIAAPAPVTYDARLWRAVLATGGTLFARTAAELWGLVDDPGHEVQIAIAPSRRIAELDGVRIHRRTIPPGDLTTRHGLPVTVRRLSAIDLIATSGYHEAMSFADRAVSQGWLSLADLDRRLLVRQRGNPMIRRVKRGLVLGAEAESERRLQKLLRQAGIQDWVGNYEVLARDRLIARIDVAFPDIKLAVEVDGFAYHSDRDRFQSDRRRQNELVVLGWTVLRFTWADLVERPGYVVATIRQHLLSGAESTA